MYTLYYSPGSCAMAVHAILNELGVDYEIKLAAKDGKKDADFLRVNPRGAVPTLVDSGRVIREGGAIITYLLDKHNSPLLPHSGPDRAAALEWLMFCNASLHPAYSKVFWGNKTAMSPQSKQQLGEESCKQIQSYMDEVESHLNGRDYLCGDKITAGDILFAVIANWSKHMPHEIKMGHTIKALLKKVTERPAFKKTLEQEKVEYKIAA